MSTALWRGAAGAAGKPLRMLVSASTDATLPRLPASSDPPASRVAEAAAAAGAAKRPLPRFLFGTTYSTDDLLTPDRATPSAPASSTAAVAVAAAAPCARTGSHMPRYYRTSCRRLHGAEIRSSLVCQRNFSASAGDPFEPSSLPVVDLMAASRQPSASTTKQFDVYIGRWQDFVKERESDMESSKRDVSVPILQELYHNRVESAIKLRGLLSPFGLTGFDAIDLNQSYKDRIGGYPKYMTTLDLMVILHNMSEVHWSGYLDNLCRIKVLVVEDWSTGLGIASSPQFHDNGMIFPSPEGDTRLRFRGECDASAIGELASLSFFIWQGAQVFKAEVYHDIPCAKNDSVEAEAWAMFLLLKRGWELGIHLHIMEARTDNKLVYEVLTGIHEIKEGKYEKVFTLLRRMSSRYRYLVPIWLPREKLIFADELLRLPLDKDNIPRNELLLSEMRKGWASFLQGSPRFIVRDHPSNLPTDLVKKGVPVKNTHQCCYVQVEEDRKVDAIWHVAAVLRPENTLFVAFRESKLNLSLREELSKLFLDGVGDCSTKLDYSLLSVRDSRMTYSKPSKKHLYIILDPTISQTPFQYKDAFIVYVLTKDEEKSMHGQGIPKFSPLSFVSFHHRANRPLGTEERKEKPKISCVSHAMSMLTSASCVGHVRQNFFKHTMKQIGLYCSMLKAQGIDAVSSHKIAAEEKYLNAMIEKANALIQELQEEVEQDRIQVVTSKKNPEEVAEALVYLSIIMKGGLKVVVSNWRREDGTSKLKSQVDRKEEERR